VTKGFDVGWTAAGEWLEYTIKVKNKGLYDFEIRAASPNADKTITLSVDGSDVTGPVKLPNTGNWQTWKSTSIKNISLNEGEHILRSKLTTGGYNLNYIKVTASATPVEEVAISPFTLYPNPAKDFIHLSANTQNNVIHQYEIVDLNGKKVLEKTFTASVSPCNESISISSIPSGMYILKVTKDDSTVSSHSFLKE